MLSLRARIFIIVSLVVLVILGISVFLVIKSKKNAADGGVTTIPGNNNVIDSTNFNYNPNIQTPIVGGQIPQGATVKPATSLEVEQNAVLQLAKIFIERYNSYSTDSNYQNIVEVQELVTDDLWKSLSAKIGKTPTGAFVGVTTKVFSSEISDWSAKAATISMSAAINEEKGGNMSDRQAKVSVSLVKNGNDWLVDKFQWE